MPATIFLCGDDERTSLLRLPCLWLFRCADVAVLDLVCFDFWLPWELAESTSEGFSSIRVFALLSLIVLRSSFRRILVF